MHVHSAVVHSTLMIHYHYHYHKIILLQSFVLFQGDTLCVLVIIMNFIINRSKGGTQWDPLHKTMFYRILIQFIKLGHY